MKFWRGLRKLEMEKNEKFEIKKEVLNYMRGLGEKLKSDLDEGELAYAKIMEDPILADKVREIERNSSNALKYYQEMESYYDKYVNINTRKPINTKKLIDVLEELSRFKDDFYKLFGGCGVGFGIRIKKE